MDLLIITPFLVAFVAVAWALVERAARRRAQRHSIELDSRKRSAATRYGHLNEQFAPFMERWPVGDPQRFRFVGDPIDGVQFTDDAVYLVEIKSAGSRLSDEQQRIREMVRAGRVGWVVFHVREDGHVEVLEPWKRLDAHARS